MVCYEHSKRAKSIGKLYILFSIIGVPLTIYFTSNSDLLFALIAKYILFGTFSILLIIGLIYTFFKGEWFLKIDDSFFEYVSPFGKSKCFRVAISEIEKLEIQQSNSVDAVFYILHLKNNQSYSLDTESLVKMSKVEKCLNKLSVKIERTTK